MNNTNTYVDLLTTDDYLLSKYPTYMKQELEDRKEIITFLMTYGYNEQYIIKSMPLFAPYDVGLCSINNVSVDDVLIEIKRRDMYYFTYKDTILEVKKYKELMQEAKKNNSSKVIYTLIFDDCIAMADLMQFDVEYLNSVKTAIPANKNTIRSKEEKVMKDVYMLPLIKFKSYNRNNHQRIKEYAYN